MENKLFPRCREVYRKREYCGETREELAKFLKRTKGEDINVDVKKLKGLWAGYYRINKGKIRIIFDVDYKNKAVFIEKIDFRGDLYKK